MVTKTDVEERLRRARTESLSFEVVNDDPLAVRVTNDDSGSSYLTVPGGGKCGCPDNTHRDVLCKHLLFLARLDTQVGETVRAYVTDQMLELTEKQDELETQLAEVESELRAYEVIQQQSDDDPRAVSETTPVEENENEDEFRSMLNDLQS